MTDLQAVYSEGVLFAAEKHKNQQFPGTNLPYLTHVVNVAMEVMVAGFNTDNFDTSFAVLVALLHDTIEDTGTNYSEVKEKFGERVADSVLALTKFDNFEKSLRMQNSIDRIKELEKEVWAVKLADRISNLQAPPIDWNRDKRIKYKEGAENILRELGEANDYLARRLADKIIQYEAFVTTGDK